MNNKIKRIVGNEYILTSGILILLICIFFKPVIFGNHTLFPILPGVTPDGPYGYHGEGAFTVVDPTSYLWIELPATIAASTMIKSGTFPLWNPYVGCGTPLAANPMSGIYNPLRFFLLLFPQPYVFDFYLLLRIFLAGFFTFIFLRKIRISQMAALFSSIAYMFSGHLMCYLTLWHVSVDMLTPFLLFLFECSVQGSKRMHTIFAGVGVALVVSAGSPQSALLCLALPSLYYFYRTASLYGMSFNSISLHKSVNLLIILSIGFGLSAFMLMDFYQLYKLSIHQISISVSDWGELNAYSPLSLVSFLFSPLQFLGTPLWDNTLNLNRFAHVFPFPYIGVITIILATMSLGKDWKLNRLSVVFISYPCLLILNILGGGIWLSHLLGDFLFPLTRLFWAKYLGTLYLSMAILAGLGLENLRNKRLLPRWNSIFISCIFLFVIVCYFVNPNAYSNTFEVKVPPAGMWTALLLPVKYALSLRALFIAMLCIALIVVYNSKGTYLYSLLVVMLFVELYFYHQPHYAIRHHPYTKAPYVDYLLKEKNKENPFRICGVGGVMIPQISSVFQLEDVNNIDALYIERYYSFMVELILGTPWHYGVLSLCPIEIEAAKNRLLDLLNVKYFISSNSLNPIEKGIIDARGNAVSRKRYFGGNVQKQFLSLYPNTKGSTHYVDTAYYTCTLPPEGALLSFTIGVDPSQWLQEGDGVEFLVQVEDAAHVDELFQKYSNPKSNQAARYWYSQETDLTPYGGKEITIIFKVKAGPHDDNRYDQCGFADIEIVPRGDNNQKLTLVYNEEVKIYRNNTVMPRSYIVHRAEYISQREKIIERLKDPHFDFRKSIIIEKELSPQMLSCNHSPSVDRSSVTIVNYGPNRVELEATMENDGFLVLSDTYYPGWKAYVNGKQVEIYLTNYLLRSLYLRKGTHQIRFVYTPLPLKAGVGISLLTLLGVAVFLCYKKKAG